MNSGLISANFNKKPGDSLKGPGMVAKPFLQYEFHPIASFFLNVCNKGLMQEPLPQICWLMDISLRYKRELQLIGNVTLFYSINCKTFPCNLSQNRNIVSTVNLSCKLDLKQIALNARNAEYNPKVLNCYFALLFNSWFNRDSPPSLLDFVTQKLQLWSSLLVGNH